VAWSVVGGAIAAALSLRYVPVLSGLASAPVVYAGFAAVWLALCAPAALVVGPHLLARLRGRTQPLRARAG